MGSPTSQNGGEPEGKDPGAQNGTPETVVASVPEVKAEPAAPDPDPIEQDTEPAAEE